MKKALPLKLILTFIITPLLFATVNNKSALADACSSGSCKCGQLNISIFKYTGGATDPIAPLAGATVSPPTNPPMPTKTTDSQGQVSFWGIPFEVTGDIKIQASGFNQGTITLSSIAKTGAAPVICTASTILSPYVPPPGSGVGGPPPGGTSATPANPQKLMYNIQMLAIGLGALIAVIRIIFGAFKLMREGDNPIALEEGRDMITSSILGLLVILFAVTLLRIILSNVLGIM